MRIFKDLDLVEQLGSGIPRILGSYGKECFKFSENFLRMIFPSAEAVNDAKQLTGQVTEQVTVQVTEQVKNLINKLDKDLSRNELMDRLGLTHREHFRMEYLQKAIELGLIELTIPEKPKSSKQQYRLTEKGKMIQTGKII